MKKFMFILLSLFFSLAIFAQGELSQSDLYLSFDWMEVEEANYGDYWDVETFWEGLHQERTNAGEIIGWDLWTVLPGGSEQGAQFLTVTLYSSFGAMMGGGGGNFMKYAKAAHPDMGDMALSKMWEKTSASRELTHRVFLKQVDATNDSFDMPIGTVASMDAMMATDKRYEKMESKIFKPMHQKAVDAGNQGNWGLLRVLLPAGSDRYASHVTVNMFKDMDQYAKAYGNWGGSSDDAAMNIAIAEGLKTRDHKAVRICTLVKKVRKQAN